jgi:fumarate reductase flavoprotein subunit
MEKGCGIYRQQDTMAECVAAVDEIKDRAAHLKLDDSSKVFNTELIAAMELISMIDVAEALVNSAIQRKESRGAHTCRDFPNRDDENYLHHSLAFCQPGGRPRIERKEVALGHWEPEERKY